MDDHTPTRARRRRFRTLLLERLETRVVPSFLAPRNFPAGEEPWSVTVGEFNGDRHMDLAVANYAGNSLSVLLGNGDGSFHTVKNSHFVFTAKSVTMGDMNGDSRLDLAVASLVTGTVGILLGNGDGSFQSPRFFPVGARPWSVAVGDVNNDGHLDVTTANAGYLPDPGHVSVLLGNGNGFFQPARQFRAGGAPVSVAMGDVNNDGRLDLAVANGDDTVVSVLIGNGDGSFQNAIHFYAGSYPIALVLGDVNQDGRLDIIMTVDTRASVLIGNGDGSFIPTGEFLPAGDKPTSLALTDINRDGSLDIAVVSLNGVRVLLGNATGSFRDLHTSYVAGAVPRSGAVADFDGNGFPDLAVANAGSNDVSILLNDGYWGGPIAFYYVYPASGTVVAGQPLTLYVVASDAQYNIVTTYTGAIAFWSTDSQASTPVYYRFQLSDRGIAAFPGGLTFHTLGLQELYVFDWLAVRVFGYAAFNVVGSGPGRSGEADAHPVLDLFASAALLQRVEPPQQLPATPTVVPLADTRPAIASVPLAVPTAPEALAPPLLDRLFAARDDRATWELLLDAPLGAGV